MAKGEETEVSDLAQDLKEAIEYSSVTMDTRELTDVLKRSLVAVDMLRELRDQHACCCGHPACNACDRTKRADAVIARAEGQE